MEIIVVDDGSTDAPDEVLKEWQAKDVRIKVLKKINGGVSSARNAGIDAATGAYIIFVDSDDELLPGAVELSVMELRDSQIDAVFYMDERHRGRPGVDGSVVYVRDEDCVEALFKLYSPASCIHKMYRRDKMGEDVRFPLNISWGEDFVFNVRYFSRCRSVCRIKRPLYYVHHQPGSLTFRYDERGFEDAAAQYEAIAPYMDAALHPDVSAIVNKRMWLCWIECVRKVSLLAPMSFSEKRAQIRQWMESDFVKDLRPEYCPKTLDCYVLRRGWVWLVVPAAHLCAWKKSVAGKLRAWLKR